MNKPTVPGPTPEPTPTLSEAEREKVKKSLVTARVDLVLKHTFFGALILRLKMIEDDKIPTACTDGTTIHYNPAFIQSLSLQHIKGVCVHEILHCAMGHVWREKDLPFPSLPKNTPKTMKPDEIEALKLVMRHDKANRAMDYAINPIVRDSGLSLPPDALLDNKYKGMSMEEIYTKMPEAKVQFICSGDGTIGQIDGKPRCGDVESCNNGSQDAQDQNDWQVAVAQAAQVARARGQLPASLEKFLGDLQKPRVDWKAILRRYIQDIAKADYTWKYPNRRFLAMGLYLPSLYSEQVGPIAVAQDTSGSMWGDRDLRACASELRSIIEDVKPSKIVLYYADAAIAATKEFDPDEPFEFAPKGGGGTSFVPVFEEIAESGFEPLCLIYFTDLQGTFPQQAPPYPVIWLTLEDGTAPFGEVLKIDLTLERG